jgi:hypothetical protein
MGTTPVTELPDLVKAVSDNLGETTPLSMLADFLSERGDGRGDILAKHLRDRPVDSRDFHLGSSVTPGSHGETVSHEEGDFGLQHWISYNPDSRLPHKLLYAVKVGEWVPGDTEMRLRGRVYTALVSHKEAREIADRLPNAERTHKFLDRHFGPDPRGEKFHRDLSEKLRK